MNETDRGRAVNLAMAMLDAGVWIASAMAAAWLAQSCSPWRIGTETHYGFASVFLFA